MVQEYSTSAQIEAAPDAVWRALTNGAAYRDWNQEIVAVDGTFAAGARITAHVKLGNGAVRRVPQRVAVFDAPRTMEWIGGLPFGLFVGRRTFTVAPKAGGTEFRMDIHMSGPLASLILKSVGNRQPEIDRFSNSLKARVEAQTDQIL